MKRVVFKLVLFISVSIAVSCHMQPKKQTTGKITNDGVSIAYEVHGTGTPALVFVHGWSCDRSYWKEQLTHFSKNHKVVAIDVAGHGESGFGPHRYTMEAFGSDVAAVVKSLNLKNVIMIGHSMGGPVIAEAARILPGRVAGLVMVDQYKKFGSFMTSQEVEAETAELRKNFTDSTRAFVRRIFSPHSDSTLREWVAADMSSAPPEVALEAYQNTLNYNRRMPQTLSELKLPVFAINDTRRPTDFASLKEYGVEALIMEGTGHFLMMEDPMQFNELLETAIRKINLTQETK